jgi:hypothetical protein
MNEDPNMAKEVTDDGTASADGGTITDASVAEAPGEVESETATEQPTEEVDPESFDPVGTLALILIYFAILAVAWVVMYFVEFLGNGPTVVG